MLLKKKYIHRSKERERAESQITLDDDFNISDNKPDVIKIITSKGEIKLDEIKVNEGHVWVKGTMAFEVLYKSDQSEMRICCITGAIPFQEKLSMDGVNESCNVKVETQMEDLTVGIINSRKLSIRSLVSFLAVAEEIADEAVSYGIEEAEDEEIQKKQKTVEALGLIMAKKDNCRFKSEITLPSNKPNVQEVLWKNVQLRNMQARLMDDRIEVTGEALVFVIYNGAEEEEKFQWLEQSVPLKGETTCSVPSEELIAKIRVEPGQMNLEVKPDYDGEERVFGLDAELELDIHIWREEQAEVLEDVYSLKKELMPKYEDCNLERFLMKNDTKCKITEQGEVPREDGTILQICSCDGKAVVESERMVEGGIEAEGTLNVVILFVTSEDSSPLGAFHMIIPFEQFIDVSGIKAEDRISLDASLEQLSAILTEGNRVEIRAVVDLNLIAFERQKIKKIEEVSEKEFDSAALQKFPGITGYLVNERDTLWNIAKENHTTIQNIIDTNQLTGKEIKAGEKLLIVKAL